jgi:hypothetical protein
MSKERDYEGHFFLVFNQSLCILEGRSGIARHKVLPVYPFTESHHFWQLVFWMNPNYHKSGAELEIPDLS